MQPERLQKMHLKVVLSIDEILQNSTLLRLGALWVIKGRLVAFDMAASKTRNQVCNHSLSVAACKAAFVH